MSIYFNINVTRRHPASLVSEAFDPSAHTPHYGNVVVPGALTERDEEDGTYYQGVHWTTGLCAVLNVDPHLSEGQLFHSLAFASRAEFRTHVASLRAAVLSRADECSDRDGYGGSTHYLSMAALLAVVESITTDMWDTHWISVRWY